MEEDQSLVKYHSRVFKNLAKNMSMSVHIAKYEDCIIINNQFYTETSSLPSTSSFQTRSNVNLTGAQRLDHNELEFEGTVGSILIPPPINKKSHTGTEI